MLKLIRRAYAVFRAYVVSDLIRSKGFVLGFISMSLWMMLFLPSLALFMDPSMENTDFISRYAFTAIAVFLLYSVATWDWAAELRWMINEGRLEYYIVSGSSFIAHFLGIIPVSLIWVSMALAVNYVVLSILWGPPILTVYNPTVLVGGIALIIVNLIAYALILGGVMISSGVTGFVVEILSFVLPIATGGLTPLANIPEPIKIFALATPFSYPAEMVRNAILGTPTVLGLEEIVLRGTVYSIAFFSAAIVFFRYQLKKVLREGVRVTSFW